MRYLTVSILGLALGVSAFPSPQWGHEDNFPSFPFGGSEHWENDPALAPISDPAPSDPVSAPEVADPSEIVDSTSSAITTAAPEPNTGSATSGGEMPPSSGTSILSAVQTIAAGESFDGGMLTYDRGVSCTGQVEGGSADTVFTLEEGASLSNVIVGPNQIEGIHCYGSCTLTNVWWAEVCEDALTIKEQADGAMTTITGGGAFHAEDKVLQHNGGGSLTVQGFTVDDFGKLYRSCGNCDSMPERHVIMEDITASNGKWLVGE